MLENISLEADLSPKQSKFIELMLAGSTIIAAAAEIDVSEQTCHRWLKQPELQAVYRNAQRTIFNNAISQLMLDVGDARTTLKDIMLDPMTSPGQRIRCAEIILTQALKASELASKNNETIERHDTSDLSNDDLLMIVQSTTILQQRKHKNVIDG